MMDKRKDKDKDKDRKKLGSGKKGDNDGIDDEPDRQMELDSVVSDGTLEEGDEEGIGETRILDFAASDSLSSATAPSGTVMVSTTDLARMIEESQKNIGRMLLKEQDEAWDRRIARLEQSQNRNLEAKISALRNELQTSIDEKICARAEATEQKLESFIEETRRAAEEARRIAEGATGATGADWGRRPMGGVGVGPSSSASGAAWVPKTVELKGFCNYNERYTNGVSSEWVAEYMGHICEALPEHQRCLVDWQRTEAANRYAYNFKLVIVLKQSSRDDDDRRAAYDLKNSLAEILTQKEFNIKGKDIYAAVQASPARRTLFAAAGKFTTAFVTLSGDPALSTKREYGASSLTVLAFHGCDEDKNAHLGKGGGKGASSEAGCWVRVGEFSADAWRLFEGECGRFGVDTAVLREKLAHS